MVRLWNKKEEKEFFRKALALASPEQLFYQCNTGQYCVYWPKNYKGTKTTLQSRNAIIGSYTEKWLTKLLNNITKEYNVYAIQGVICEEIALTSKSPADVAICKTNEIVQKAENILMILEVKMSIVWNWELTSDDLHYLGDYKTHQGTPGLLRSDSMLKAIGKSINIRISSHKASNIPILIVGNTPIKKSYYKKVDQLKRNGIIQGFCSLNPRPLDQEDKENIKHTQYKGFYRLDNYKEFAQYIATYLNNRKTFFSAMLSSNELGRMIEIANKEKSYEAKAHHFLKLLREGLY